MEWITNPRCFPPIDDYVNLPSSELEANQLNQVCPMSPLETCSGESTTASTAKIRHFLGFDVPVKARRKRRRRTDFKSFPGLLPSVAAEIEKQCHHCGTERAPQWRKGPLGLKNLCNACGIRFKSQGLLPEYRPANNPTFTVGIHSNSHRKIEEMRKKLYVRPAITGFKFCQKQFNKTTNLIEKPYKIKEKI